MHGVTAWRRPAGVGLVAAGLALVLALTLTPAAGPDVGAFLWCVRCGDFGLSDFIANVLLFVPLAAGLMVCGVAARRIVAAAFLLATAIELAQLAIPGRESTLGDVLAAALGAALVVLGRRAWPARRSVRAGLLAAAAALSLVTLAGLALRPSLPPTVWYGQWTAALGQFEWYRGRLLRVTLGGAPLADGRFPDSRPVRAGLAAGEPLAVRAVAGPRTRRLAPLFSIADSAYREILVVGADRDDLVLRVRTVAAGLGLAQPDIRWRGALAAARPGDTLAIGMRRNGRGYCLEVNGTERCGLGVTAGRAWALLRDVPELPAAAQAALDCVCVALLMLAVGLVTTRNAAGLVTALGALAGMAALPPALGLLPTPALQLAASAAGFVAGRLAPGAGERAHAPVDLGVG